MIAYSHCWEDADLLLEALQLKADDVVLSITSGGCNTLTLAEKMPEVIYSIDKTESQNYLLELKLAALTELDAKSVLEFLGYAQSSSRIAIFERLRKHLSNKADAFWSENTADIEKGIVHCGMFEKYLRLFRRRVLPLIHSKKRIQQLLTDKNAEEQKQFYIKKWDNPRWRLLFVLFFSKAVMSGRGRKKEMFEHNTQKSVASRFYERTRSAFMQGPIFNNFYLNYILLKQPSNLPLYLQGLNSSNPFRYKNIKIESVDLLSFLRNMPDNSISKYNLSDVFEPLSAALMQEIFSEIYRTAKHEARIIFYNNLVKRDIPESLLNKFERQTQLESELVKKNQVFFYEGFLIYKVIKSQTDYESA